MCGEGLLTVEAEDQEDARSSFTDLMADLPDVVIQEVRELVELPDGINFAPRTLQ